MPELPEVEVVRQDLRKFVLNKTITNILIKDDKIIKFPTISSFKSELLNQKINEVSRIGKNIIFILDNYVLISHLRMEGKYFFKKNDNANNNLKHNMITFELDNSYLLFYLDSRKFGTMHLFDKQDYKNNYVLAKVGFEPFDSRLTIEYLQSKWKNKRRAIKTLLLDQSYIAGIGNIYADEILFACKIHPLKQGKDLTKENIFNIIKYSKDILSKAIKYGGTRIKSFESVNHMQGEFQNFLQVHLKKNYKCKRCATIITKMVVNGRGTYLCTNCQKK